MIILLLIVIGAAVGFYFLKKNSPQHAKAISDEAKVLKQKASDAVKAEVAKLKTKTEPAPVVPVVVTKVS